MVVEGRESTDRLAVHIYKNKSIQLSNLLLSSQKSVTTSSQKLLPLETTSLILLEYEGPNGKVAADPKLSHGRESSNLTTPIPSEQKMKKLDSTIEIDGECTVELLKSNAQEAAQEDDIHLTVDCSLPVAGKSISLMPGFTSYHPLSPTHTQINPSIHIAK